MYHIYIQSDISKGQEEGNTKGKKFYLHNNKTSTFGLFTGTLGGIDGGLGGEDGKQLKEVNNLLELRDPF